MPIGEADTLNSFAEENYGLKTMPELKRGNGLGAFWRGLIFNNMDKIICPIIDCEEELEVLDEDLVCPVHGAVYLDDYVQDEPGVDHY